MHREIMGALSTAIPLGRARLVAAVPHGFGKTTIAAIALPLWALAYCHSRHCVIISDTRPRAGEALACIARELVTNKRLLSDFPHLRGLRRAGPSAREVVIGNIARVSVASRATGLGGRRFGPIRPDLIIVDEVEGVGGQFKPVTEDWLSAAVIAPGNASANVVVVGTLWKDGSIVEELIHQSEGGKDGSKTWWARRYKAVLLYPQQTDLWIQFELVFHGIARHEGQTGPGAAAEMVRARGAEMAAGAQLLWPEHARITDLLQRKVREGWWRFDAALQSRPQQKCVHVTLDYGGRNDPPPYEWTDDAGLVRNSYQDDPATGRVLLPGEREQFHGGWQTIMINTGQRGRTPRLLLSKSDGDKTPHGEPC